MATIPSMDPYSPVEERLQMAEGLFDIVERAMNHTRATGSAIVLRRDNDWIVRTSTGTAPEVGAAFHFGSCVVGECARTGKPFTGPLTEANLDPVLRPLGVRSILATPVLVDRATEGVLVVLQQTPEAFSRMHGAIMMTMSTEVAGVMKRFESALKEVPQLRPIAVPLPPRSPMASAPANVVPAATLNPVTSAQNIVETVKKLEAPIPTPMKLMIDQPIAPKAPKPTVTAAETVKSTLVDPARVASMSLFELETSHAPAKRAPEVLTIGEDPLKHTGMKIAAQGARRAESFSAVPRYTPAKKSRPMIAPLIAVTVLALAGGTFGAWRHNHVTAIASAPTSTAPSPHLVAVPISAPVAETAPTAAAPVKELAPKPEAAKFAAEKKDEPAEVTPIPAAMIRVAAAHTKVDSTAVDAPSLNLIAGGALPQLPAPKAVSASLAVKKSIAIPAALVQSVAPAYPEIARRNGIGGEVHVQMTVTTAGKVSAVRAVSGPAMLRAAATNAVSQWQYRPATLDGRAIDSTVDVMVKFAAAR